MCLQLRSVWVDFMLMGRLRANLGEIMGKADFTRPRSTTLIPVPSMVIMTRSYYVSASRHVQGSLLQ